MEAVTAKLWARTLGTADAAQQLGVSRRRVLALIATGRLPAWRVGRDWRIDPQILTHVKHRRPGRPPSPRQEQGHANASDGWSEDA
jgi:excisionase family DNA binding protein